IPTIEPADSVQPVMEAHRPLAQFPPLEHWKDWEEWDASAWPRRKKRRYSIHTTTCFNCESACGLLAYVDKDSGRVRRFEGNPYHPGSRGRLCAKGPATINQINDPERILYPLKRKGARGSGEWERIGWEQALEEIAAGIRKALQEKRHNKVVYHVGRPGKLLGHQHGADHRGRFGPVENAQRLRRGTVQKRRSRFLTDFLA
ncbi:MAG: molybdopterin-dependent oxidoreductase, partial [bacterium]